ncbi:hypothetical protein ACFWV1_26130 [Streptomyces sp. NPDC058700]|uniref:DUF6197 family protein n=1 Tax=Streptomyces sp. NPDC058700 TaxID=3346607 RepID=UPI003659B60A
MSETARILRVAAHAATYYGLQTGPRYADANGRLDLVAAIYVAATGKIPAAFRTDNELASLLIETNEPVMAAIRAVSDALGTDVPTDSETGAPCHVEHLCYWQADRQHTTGEPPTEAEIVGLLLRAACDNDTSTQTSTTFVPRQRAAA